ncbi:MAG: hypothetical protein ACRD2F_03225 [Terriglobales bacterium]
MGVSINLRQLRNTKQLKAWLRAGRTVELRQRDQVIARIVPVHEAESRASWPDFAARRRKIFGDKVLNIVDDFLKDRHREGD